MSFFFFFIWSRFLFFSSRDCLESACSLFGGSELNSAFKLQAFSLFFCLSVFWLFSILSNCLSRSFLICIDLLPGTFCPCYFRAKWALKINFIVKIWSRFGFFLRGTAQNPHIVFLEGRNWIRLLWTKQLKYELVCHTQSISRTYNLYMKLSLFLNCRLS